MNYESKFYYLQSIKEALVSQNSSIKIWAQLNYVNYLYYYRDYLNLTPILMETVSLIEKTPHEQLILPGESFKKIGCIMHTLGDDEQAFNYLNLAKKYAIKNTSEYVEIINAIGLNNLNSGNIKDAESCFLQAIFIAKKLKNGMLYAKSIGNLALVNQQKGNYNDAITLLEKDISISKENENNRNTIQASIQLAKILILKQELTKAEELLDNVLKIAQLESNFEKLEFEIIELKLYILKQLNKTDDELELRRRYIDLKDSLKDKDGAIAIIKSNWIIQKIKLQQNIVKTENQHKQLSTMNNLYTLITAFILLITFVFFKKYKKQFENRETQYEQKETFLELERRKTEKKLSEAYHFLNTHVVSLENKDNQIKKLEGEINYIRKSVVPPSSANYPIEKETGKLNSLLQSHLMTNQNWIIFKKEFQKEYPEFYHLLQNDFPELTISNKRILLLEKLNYKNKEIAEILGVTPEAVKKSKLRLKKKLGPKYKLLFDHVNS